MGACRRYGFYHTCTRQILAIFLKVSESYIGIRFF